MNTTRTILVSMCCAIISIGALAPSQAGVLIAESDFNIPPFTAGIPVHGQGASEPGWAAPWQKLGGFDDRGHVVSNPTQEGSGAVQLFADNVFGTSVEREWMNIVPKVRVDGYVYVTPGASMQGQIVTATPASGEIVSRTAGAFRIDGSGLIRVFDAKAGGFVSTSFFTIPYQWNKYSLIVDMNSKSYNFLFNDQLYGSPHPLTLMNPMFYVDGINYSASGTLTTYVDNIRVTPVPEPSTAVLALLGAGALLYRARRRAFNARATSSPSPAPPPELRSSAHGATG